MNLEHIFGCIQRMYDMWEYLTEERKEIVMQDFLLSELVFEEYSYDLSSHDPDFYLDALITSNFRQYFETFLNHNVYVDDCDNLVVFLHNDETAIELLEVEFDAIRRLSPNYLDDFITFLEGIDYIFAYDFDQTVDLIESYFPDVNIFSQFWTNVIYSDEDYLEFYYVDFIGEVVRGEFSCDRTMTALYTRYEPVKGEITPLDFDFKPYTLDRLKEAVEEAIATITNSLGFDWSKVKAYEVLDDLSIIIRVDDGLFRIFPQYEGVITDLKRSNPVDIEFYAKKFGVEA